MNVAHASSLPARLRVVVIGGGFSGAAVAWQLAEMAVPAVITVVEPRAQLGRGLAYSTDDVVHRINVPAQRMSLDPDHRGDFADWIAAAPDVLDAEAETFGGDVFPSRTLFGEYVGDRLAPHLKAGLVRHLRARVSDIERSLDGVMVLILSDESRIRADLVVLATGHPAPAVPKVLAGLAGTAQMIADPHDPVRLASVGKDEKVLVLGAALTSADVIASLDRQGFAGQITCLSRRGLRSRGHSKVTQESEVDFAVATGAKASDLLRHVRHAIIDDQARGESWHATLHRLRAQGPQIWAALDLPTRARLLRHLRSFWDVHRFRIAPQTEAVLDRLLAESRLDYAAGHLISAVRAGGQVEVSWRMRGGTQIRRESFDQIINTTGPAQGRCIDWNPALAALSRLGLIAPDDLGLGLATTGGCHAVDATGASSDRILIAGPLARGHIGELVGAPECAAHARLVAKDIAKRVFLTPILRPEPAHDAGLAAKQA